MRISQANGRSTIDEGAIKLCVEQLNTAMCIDISGLLTGATPADMPGCGRIAKGLVPTGGGCDRNYECMEGNYCNGVACVPLPGLDESCPDGQCAAGLYCRSFNPGPRCAPKEADGRLCDNPTECKSGSCNTDPVYQHNVCGAPTTCVGRTIVN
jgi:hypothetical protein